MAPVLLVVLLIGSVRSDVITLDSGSFPQASSLATAEGFSPGSEVSATSFVVPGAGNVNLTFEFVIEDGFFDSAAGFFDSSSVTADPNTDLQLWATQALSNSTLIFDERESLVGDAVTHTVMGGTALGFFIVPHDTLANFLTNPNAYYPPTSPAFLDPAERYRSPLFSNSAANPDQRDQMLAFIGTDRTLVTFEDVTRGTFPAPFNPSDQDFADFGFTIDAALVPVPEPDSGFSLMLLVFCFAAVARNAYLTQRTPSTISK